MNIKKFIQDNTINSNDTHEWIDLIQIFIEEFGLQSALVENNYGTGIYISTQKEHQLLEELLYEVEETKTTLNYIFEGNVKYGKDYDDE